MTLIIEILFFIIGVYALITAKLPSWALGKGYKAEGRKARLLGGIMASTLPLVVCGAVTIGIIGAEGGWDNSTAIASIFELSLVFVIAIGVFIIIRNIRERETPSAINPDEQPPLN